MAEIKNGVFVRNETNQNSMGGTERMVMELSNHIEVPLLLEFQIVSSRVRDLEDDKIRIFWAHDLPGDPESEFLKDKNNHSLFHKFVFVSNWQMQGYMQAYGIPWSKCIVLQNAITPIGAHEKPDTKDGIRFIYHSTPHRGLNILVPVFTKLAEKYDDIHLDVYSSFELYGWGERDADFKRTFDDIDAHAQMTNHGTVDNKTIREALMNSHVFAYPSIWPETSCLCLIEAMSAGLNCIHSNYGALYETSANWTNMYQLHEDANSHAAHFYNMIDALINRIKSKGYENEKVGLNMMQSYTDVFYSWDLRATQWTALLNTLLNTVEDRSLPSEKFNYSS